MLLLTGHLLVRAAAYLRLLTLELGPLSHPRVTNSNPRGTTLNPNPTPAPLSRRPVRRRLGYPEEGAAASNPNANPNPNPNPNPYPNPHDDKAHVMLADTSAGAAASGAETLHSRKYAGVLYLSKGWKSAWGGALVDLELEAEMVPAYNSLVVFEARRPRRTAAPRLPPPLPRRRPAAPPPQPRHRVAAGKATPRPGHSVTECAATRARCDRVPPSPRTPAPRRCRACTSWRPC